MKKLGSLSLFFAAILSGTSFFPAIAQESAEHAVLADPSGEQIVIGSAHKLESTVYGETKLVTVRLPRGYGENPEKRYPVVFSVDGGPEQDFELLSGIAAEAEMSTSFDPFILIGVRTDNRYAQLTPPLKRVEQKALTDVSAIGCSRTAHRNSESFWRATSFRGLLHAIARIGRF